MHISKIEPKTADNILNLLNEGGWYVQNILRAAAILVVTDRADYEYGGQWTGGTTWWFKANATLSVSIEGKINA